MPSPEEFKEVTGLSALKWVAEQNKITQDHFDHSAEFHDTQQKCFDVLSSKQKLPLAAFIKTGKLLNFWRDDVNPKGMVRQTDFDSYCTANPSWEVLLDIDALSIAEGKNWVYGGVIENEKDLTTNRVMILLSDGGSDATVAREFDVDSKSFVENGFYIPEAKMDIDWHSNDCLLVGTDFGGDSLTASGYPATVRLLNRNQPFNEAKEIFRVSNDNLSVEIKSESTKNNHYLFFINHIDFYSTEYYLISDAFLPHKLPIPKDAELQTVFNNIALFILRDAWQLNTDTCFQKDSLIGLDLEKFKLNPELTVDALNVTLWFLPAERGAIESVCCNSDTVFISLLNNVSGELITMRPTPNGFLQEKIALPPHGDISVVAADINRSDVLISFETFISPRCLYLYDTQQKTMKQLKKGPQFFDETKYSVMQFEAISKNGTKIPYFLVAKKDLVWDGLNPTLLYGYGGFEVSLTPAYCTLDGIGLLEKGFVYVQANIRGGGEFGAQWHEMGSAKNKQNSFDDFIAVAEDLIIKKITSAKYLGIEGGSNGGLLVGACAMQRPELFGAVLCEVPLLDMLSYHELLAGPSWVGEYGDPKDPEMRAIIARYSPLQNIRPDKNYPLMFIQTSTKDDRVHPYHARMMAESLLRRGVRVYYFEDTDGGHSSGSNLKKIAENYARNYCYLYQQLLRPSIEMRQYLREDRQAGLFDSPARKRARVEAKANSKPMSFSA